MKYLLVLDIGGSFIKYGLATESGTLLADTVSQTPSHAEESAGLILQVLSDILQKFQQYPLSGACVAIAGPFDFETGISRMKHKFPALYGRSLCPPFIEKGVPVSFLHDSTAFLLGEYGEGTLAGAIRPCCVMLGTGLGFAFMSAGRVCVNAAQAPALSLWNTPFRNGIAEDYISTRAIQRTYGQAISVKEIAARAKAGDVSAINAFRLTGEALAELLTPLLEHMNCDRFSLGGQVARSAELLHLNLRIPWNISRHLDDAALRGACRYALYGSENCVQITTC